MEIILIIIGVLGSIASIYGAYLAIKAKNEAESAASIAESAKNEVLSKQKTTSLTGIMFEAKRTQQVFGKYSLTASNAFESSSSCFNNCLKNILLSMTELFAINIR